MFSHTAVRGILPQAGYPPGNPSHGAIRRRPTASLRSEFNTQAVAAKQVTQPRPGLADSAARRKIFDKRKTKKEKKERERKKRSKRKKEKEIKRKKKKEKKVGYIYKYIHIPIKGYV